MKTLISISIFSLCIAFLAIPGKAQNKRPVAKPKPSPSDQEKKSSTSPVNTPADASTESIAKINEPTAAPTTVTLAPTEIYRVGVGDILDIRLLNSVSGERSTLFTVVAGGMIEFPLAGGALTVAGLTTDEIQNRIASELKRRAVEDKAKISVGVRQYVSHSVMVTGLVASPGIRFLRREAVPLYVVFAESPLRNDAGCVVIMRAGSIGQCLNLSDPSSLNTTVISGDVITVGGRPQEFYYIGGSVNYGGQKNFQTGITLLQAILAAGGTSRKNEYKVEISREGSDKRLLTTRFSLKEIKSGSVEDPKLQPGDRIEVLH